NKWDGKRASELLAQVGEVGRKDPTYWWFLAMTRYRIGDWKGSIETFRKSWGLRYGHRSSDGFVLAMAYWKLGDRAEARKWDDDPARWLDSKAPANPVHKQLRDEAAALLGLAVRSSAAPPP